MKERPFHVRTAEMIYVRPPVKWNPLAVLISCFLALVVAGCQEPEKHIQVQVFITTKGGENIKLGAVPIEVMDEATFHKNINDWNDGIQKQKRKDLILELKTDTENEIAILNRWEKENGSGPELTGRKLRTVHDSIKWEQKRKNAFHTWLEIDKYQTARTDPNGT